MAWARLHRWLAIVLVAPLIVWAITGLLFHLKPGWDRAYEMLSVERPAALHPGELIAPTSLGVEIRKLEAFDTAIGPIFRVTRRSETELVDARTGKPRSPLALDDARALVVDAVSRSPNAEAYGDITEVTASAASVRVRFRDDRIVEIDRTNARIAQRGRDTDRIDWLYRIHYLQWTGNAAVDRAIGVAGLVLIWAVLLLGIGLFVITARRARTTGS